MAQDATAAQAAGSGKAMDEAADTAGLLTFPGSDAPTTAGTIGVRLDLAPLEQAPERSAAARLYFSHGLRALHAAEAGAAAWVAGCSEPSLHALALAARDGAATLAGLLGDLGAAPADPAPPAVIGLDATEGATRTALVATAVWLAQARAMALAALLEQVATALEMPHPAATLRAWRQARQPVLDRLAPGHLVPALNGAIPAEALAGAFG